MLTRILEKLLDPEPFSPQVRAIGSLLMIGGAIVFLLETGKDPPHAEELTKARALTYNGVISKRDLNVRGQYDVWMKQQQKQLLLSETHCFYEQVAYARLVQAMSNDLFPYDEARPFVLPIQVQTGDSIRKKVGTLTIQIIRDGKSQTFRYKCPYHHYLL